MNFKITIKGKNFKMAMDGKLEKLSFTKTEFLSRPTIYDAEQTALRQISSDLGDNVLNDEDDPPLLDIFETIEISLTDMKAENTPYIWIINESDS